MFTLKAPYGAAQQSSSYFTDPILGDGEAAYVEANYKEAISGKPWVYSKRGKYTRLTFEWDVMGRAKMIEMSEFIKQHAGDLIFIEDHNGRQWTGYYEDAEVTFSTGVRNASHGPGRQEAGSISLTFLAQELP